MSPQSPRDALLGRVIDFFAEHGIGETSLRAIAAGVGTSHRMLIHHFGSRDGLLRAVVEAVEAGHRASLAEIAGGDVDPREAAWRFWVATREGAMTFGPLLFELSAHAMQGREHAASLRESLIVEWVKPLARFWVQAGVAEDEACAQARLDLAVARGVLQDLLLTGDVPAADAAMHRYVQAVSPPL